MNPKHHALLTKLMNIGISKKEQQDIPEYNRIYVQPDAISAIRVTYCSDGNQHKTFMGTKEYDKANISKLMDQYGVTRTDKVGCIGKYNRKRLVDMLQNMDCRDVVLMIHGNDEPMMIRGYYEDEMVDVDCIILPVVDVE